MTGSELQKLIDWIAVNVPKHPLILDSQNDYDIEAAVQFNELMEMLSQYPVEEKKECTASLNYEAEYKRARAEIQELEDKINRLENDADRITRRLCRYEGAVAMAELIYGRKFIR